MFLLLIRVRVQTLLIIITARNRMYEVGLVVAQYIDVPFYAITIIGPSLGAHVAEAAGKRTSRGRIHAIAGLDPAGPLFSLDNPADRLHSTGKDGSYVSLEIKLNLIVNNLNDRI